VLIISSTKDAVVEIGLHAFQQTQLCIVIQKNAIHVLWIDGFIPTEKKLASVLC